MEPPLQLPSAEWVPINEALERIKQQPGTLLTGDLHQDLKDGRLQAARQYIILRATDRDGTHLYFAYKEQFVSPKEFVSPDRSKAAIFKTVEDARRTARIKEFAEAVGPSLSFKPLEIGELCERSYWETVTLVERKHEDGKWTCQIYKSYGFERFSEGFFYVGRADLDKHYPAAHRPNQVSSPPSPQKPGPKPREDWPTVLAALLICVARDEPRRLKHIDKLTDDMEEKLGEYLKEPPKDREAIRKKIVTLLRFIDR